MIRVWDKEKIRVPDKNRTHDLPNSGWVFNPLSSHVTGVLYTAQVINIVIRTVKVIVSSNK